MTAFTPFASLAGGMLIGFAALLFLLATGRIAGISGIVSRLLPPGTMTNSNGVSAVFLLGMLAAIPLYQLFSGTLPALTLTESRPLLIAAGLLVGFGSVLGNGCTSGHGVCGISRFSMRSIIATAIFFSAAVITVYVIRHLVGGAS